MYNYKQLEDEYPLFIFKTKSYLTYIVSLIPENFNNPYFNNLYALDFSEINNRSDSHDEFIKPTILKIINEFLISNPYALLHYVCDSVDGKQEYRKRLFKHWYSNHNTKNLSKLTINYPTQDINYSLEFIFHSDYYKLEELQEKVITQMNEFSNQK